jgi:hypothetical protein
MLINAYFSKVLDILSKDRTYLVLNGVMFPHYLIEGVSIESSHEQENHARALPPGIGTFSVFGEEKSCRET